MKKWPANLMTAGNLFCGLLSVLMATTGHPLVAGWLIILAALLDALDGKAARFFGSSSAFGIQFDSMADMVSFGVAPATLVYQIAFSDSGIPGLLITFVPVLFTALRLARFNVSADFKSHDFVGLSSPLHACLISSFVIMSYALWDEIADPNVLAGLIIISSLLMVSRFPLTGLPRISLREPGYNLVKLLFLLGALVAMGINPPRYTFPVLVAVVAAGFISGTVRAVLKRHEEPDEDELDDGETEPITVYRGRR
jgi:CDP-diacylglycerol---serine O-phosphatidyltransferase